MSVIRQIFIDLEQASPPTVGAEEEWDAGYTHRHKHSRHQFLYATKGVVHFITDAGEWVLPPSRALWIPAQTEHTYIVKKFATTRILYIDSSAYPEMNTLPCMVVNVSPLIRELVAACAKFTWDYTVDSAEARLAQVLMEQLQAYDQAPVHLPLPADARALKVVDILRNDLANRESLEVLSKQAGASARTIERLFLKETELTFGTWRYRQRLLAALEYLAYGESITSIAFNIGYESPPSFVAAFRAMFGTTPGRYFKQNDNR